MHWLLDVLLNATLILMRGSFISLVTAICALLVILIFAVKDCYIELLSENNIRCLCVAEGYSNSSDRPRPNVTASSIGLTAEFLCRGVTDDRRKADLIFRWITGNITYDVQKYRKHSHSEQDAESVMRRRVALCEGYSRLFVEMTKAVGIHAVMIRGRVRVPSALATHPIEAWHGWNAVSLHGRWFLLDCTYGAGSVDGDTFFADFQSYYFLTPPNLFIRDHFPTDARWQLLNHPYSHEQFRRSRMPDLYHLSPSPVYAGQSRSR